MECIGAMTAPGREVPLSMSGPQTTLGNRLGVASTFIENALEGDYPSYDQA
jgi:hypothetical protein